MTFLLLQVQNGCKVYGSKCEISHINTNLTVPLCKPSHDITITSIMEEMPIPDFGLSLVFKYSFYLFDVLTFRNNRPVRVDFKFNRQTNMFVRTLFQRNGKWRNRLCCWRESKFSSGQFCCWLHHVSSHNNSVSFLRVIAFSNFSQGYVDIYIYILNCRNLFVTKVHARV